MAFLIDLVPKGNNKLVELYIRELGKSSSSLVEMEHIIPTWPLGWETAMQILGAVKNNPELQKLAVRFRLIPVGRKETDLSKYTEEQIRDLKELSKFCIWAHGPRKMKKLLPHDFICQPKDPRNNAARLLRWRNNIPFSVYGSKEKVPIEILLQEKLLAFDLEYRNKPAYDDLFQCAIVTSIRDYILAKDVMGIRNLAMEVNGEQFEFEIIHTSDIPKTLEGIIHDYEPYIITGHNIGNYDLKRLRDENGFAPGIEVIKAGKSKSAKPHIKTAGFFSKADTAGMDTIDAAPFSQHYLPTINNRLPTVASFLFKQPLKKDLDYNELEKLAYTNPEECARYVAKDTILSFQICKRLQKNILFLSKLFRQRPSAICCTSKDNLAIDVHEQLQFDRLYTYGYRTPEAQKKLEQFDVYGMQSELLNTNQHTRGFFNARVCFPMPFLNALYPIIKVDRYAKAVLDEIFDAEDWLDKLILAQGLNAYLKKALFDLCLLSGEEKLKQRELFSNLRGYFFQEAEPYRLKTESIESRADWFYGKIFGIKFGKWPDTRNVQEITKNILSCFAKLNEFIANNPLLNFSDKYLLFDEKADLSAIEELAINCGEARVFSLEKGSFIADIDGRLVVQAKDITGRKGDKCELEREYIPLLADAALKGDKAGAEELIYGCLRDLGKGRKEDLVFKNIMRRDFYDFRPEAQRRKMVKMAIIKGKMKGEENKWGFTIEEKLTPNFMERGTVDINRYKDIFFGHLHNGKRKGGSLGCFIYPLLGNLSNYVDRLQLRLL